MATWSGIRKKLESEYLAKSLQGHIQYYATTYSRSHDHEGRAAIRYDGKEIIKGCYWYNWTKAGQFPKDEKYERRMREENAFMDDTALKLGVFDQRSFYAAFQEFDQQSIEKSLKSENLIVRIFAVLDRRVGKRRLLMMKDTIEQEPDTFKEFYAIRARAEGIKL
ncbi:SF0329 family protein [Peptostreptococcus stomatis]|uniref:SF0329 family protein n=1 Tax=Peptostreptococcus stomatis TaxID=341694 RepID=UPI003F9FCCBC